MISVIVPIYKVEKYLNQCIDSIVNQTYKDLEIILVDDGSPDSCPQICDEWSKKDKRIVVIHKVNGGLSSARNAGIKHAKGEFIGFIDSDDFIEKDMYGTLLNGFGTSKDIGITACMISSWRNGNIMPYNPKWTIEKPRVISCSDFALKMITQSVNYTVYNKLYKSSIVKQVRFREGRNNEDTLYMYDVSKVMRKEHLAMLELPYFFYYYRQREDSITTSVTIPLEKDVIANYRDLMIDCQNEDPVLYNTIYDKYVRTLYHFLDSMLIHEDWRKKYFSEYQRMLENVPHSYILSHFAANDIIYIWLLLHIPFIRKVFRKIKININR